MDDQHILDAPEGDENGQLKIPFKLVLFTIIGMTIAYSIFFGISSLNYLSLSNIKIWIFKIDLYQLVFLAGTSLGLYLFTSFIKFDLSSHWFRVMTMSVTIVLIAVLLTNLLIIRHPEEDFFTVLKPMGFIALAAGGGCSLAIQFLLKKHYFIFSAIMICTIVFFSFIDYF